MRRKQLRRTVAEVSLFEEEDHDRYAVLVHVVTYRRFDR